MTNAPSSVDGVKKKIDQWSKKKQIETKVDREDEKLEEKGILSYPQINC